MRRALLASRRGGSDSGGARLGNQDGGREDRAVSGALAWRLTPLAESVWVAATPIRLAGVWFPHVMTAIRLDDGTVLLHSPCRLSDELRADLEPLGKVADVVAPNWFHDLYLADYRRTYPAAVFWAPVMLRRLKGSRLPDRSFARDCYACRYDSNFKTFSAMLSNGGSSSMVAAAT
jgi:hypothetical protein